MGDLSSGERGSQMISLNAIEMLYNFGKVKSGVDIQQAKLAAEQAGVLISIDNMAYETATAIVNIKRYLEITRIVIPISWAIRQGSNSVLIRV